MLWSRKEQRGDPRHVHAVPVIGFVSSATIDELRVGTLLESAIPCSAGSGGASYFVTGVEHLAAFASVLVEFWSTATTF
jgi:hypothetical protein